MFLRALHIRLFRGGGGEMLTENIQFGFKGKFLIIKKLKYEKLMK